MITGIGTDIVSVNRIRKIIARHAGAFLEQVFTQEERQEGELRSRSYEYFAGRWAVKEALSKALGCGIGARCHWQDISTTNAPGGRPVTKVSGIAAVTAAELGVSHIHTSVSHEQEYAGATVILESDHTASTESRG